MKKQITSISSFQTSKIVAILYFIVTIPFVILFFLGSLFAPGSRHFSPLLLLLAPFFYALVGFVISFIGTWIYNQVARRFGGIEYTTAEKREP